MHKNRSQNPCTPDAVSAMAERFGFRLEADVCVSLSTYLELLIKWNRVMNLVGPSTWETVFDSLVVDSLHLASFLPQLRLPEAPDCRDLGAGAGMPGLPLRMIWQQGMYVLVESREKRALFLSTVLASCPLPGVTVFHGRAEDYMAAHGPADLTVSRAFMPWRQLLSLVERHTAAGGLCVFLALIPLPESLPEGWQAVNEKHYTAAGDNRWFWAVRKL